MVETFLWWRARCKAENVSTMHPTTEYTLASILFVQDPLVVSFSELSCGVFELSCAVICFPVMWNFDAMHLNFTPEIKRSVQMFQWRRQGREQREWRPRCILWGEETSGLDPRILYCFEMKFEQKIALAESRHMHWKIYLPEFRYVLSVCFLSSEVGFFIWNSPPTLETITLYIQKKSTPLKQYSNFVST